MLRAFLFAAAITIAAPRPARAGCSGPTEAAVSAWPSGRRLPGGLRPHPVPGLAAVMATVPGLGHVYVCDWAGMGVSLGATLGPIYGASLLLADGVPGDDPFSSSLLYGTQNAWFYSIYDAWRLARLARAGDGRPARLDTDGARVREHLLAPFHRESLTDPWVIGAAGLGAALSAGLALAGERSGDPLWSRRTVPWAGNPVPTGVGLLGGEAVWATTFVTVGPGEEALFRGVLQPTLVEWMGPALGIASASLLFGAAHYANGGDWRSGVATAAVTGSLGAGLGVLAHHDRYRLRRPIAAHFWYDMAVGTAAFLVDPDAMPWSGSFQVEF